MVIPVLVLLLKRAPPALSQIGQSTGWLTSVNSRICRRMVSTRGVAVFTSICRSRSKAGRHKLWLTNNLDETLPTHRRRAEPRMVAEVAYVDAVLQTDFKQVGTLLAWTSRPSSLMVQSSLGGGALLAGPAGAVLAGAGGAAAGGGGRLAVSRRRLRCSTRWGWGLCHDLRCLVG